MEWNWAFWGLFLVLGLILVGYLCWMVWVERSALEGDRAEKEEGEGT